MSPAWEGEESPEGGGGEEEGGGREGRREGRGRKGGFEIVGDMDLESIPLDTPPQVRDYPMSEDQSHEEGMEEWGEEGEEERWVKEKQEWPEHRKEL